MNVNKSQQLWFWLNQFDREESNMIDLLLTEQEQFPFFYLLNWNFKFGDNQLRKTALQSPMRSQFYQSYVNAPQILIHKESNISQNDIIDDFLLKMPSLAKAKKQLQNEGWNDEIDLSAVDFKYPISETFAIILVKQQKYQQAINIYEELMLAKPEKRLYFATRISELKQNINE
jgi:hypothetical protein